MDFDDWFYEREGYGFRAERFWDDFEGQDRIAMIKWLKSAYQMGYYDGQKLYGGQNELHT